MTVKRNVLLNPGPATTTDTVKMAQVIPDICPREQEFLDIMKDLRHDLVKVVHGDERYTSVLFCGSGTLNMDVCLNSLLPADKKILVANNGAYSSRAVEVCQYYGMPHIDLSLPIETPVDPSLVDKALTENPDVALVYTTHHETGSGVLNPIREIGAVAHKHGCTFIVDTTSTYASDVRTRLRSLLRFRRGPSTATFSVSMISLRRLARCILHRLSRRSTRHGRR